tara:strand:- start:2654 stop:3031 length:378 start_codon:yes stop_codon:yes gene_type:complete
MKLKVNLKLLRLYLNKMRFLLILLLTIFQFNLYFPNKAFAETDLNLYLNDFYDKSNKANEILKEIEKTLKEGSRIKVCSKQKEAARLGLLANESLLKAFDKKGTEPPIDAINASNKRWKSILNKC